ncbi:MAG TPA: peptidylprolyl isomerase, partial [Lacipirellulaceae bacterium]|nr:peptidylprolyl isomerase [Lacipirellulaceae bacterium]
LLAVANDAEDPPFLGPVGDAETAVGAATSLTLTATHLSGGDVHFSIVAAATLEPPANVQIVVDQQTGEATLTPMPGFVGTIELLARVRAADAADEADSYDTQAFTLTARGAVIDEVADQTTSMGESITLTLTSVDHVGSGVEYVVVDPTTFEAPANVTIVINQATGEVTLTPAAGFGGVIPLRAGVRSLVSPDEPLNYSTALFELQVSSDVSLAPLEDVELPGSKSVLVPLTGADAGGQGITYSFESSDPTVQFEIFASTSQSIVLNVTGLDADGNPFTGRLVLRLFEDVAPETTAHIKQLIADGFYDNLTFHRVIDGFMAQGGANAGTLIDDEFSSLLTFTSRGLLAMANRGPDTGDAQFFITALSSAGTDDPIPVAQMPQHLNFRHTIFGQLVEGFEVFESLMKTPVVLNPQTGEVSRPATEVKIISAEVIDDDQNGVLRIFAPAGLTGTATITVTAANGTGQSATQTFTVSGVADTRVDPPFLGPVTNRTTVAGTPNSFTLTSTDTEGAGVFYRIVDPVTLQPPANVTVNINQATGEVTLTPAAGFTGTINLLAGVRGAGRPRPSSTRPYI